MEVCPVKTFIAITQAQHDTNKIVFQKVEIIKREKKKEQKIFKLAL